MLPAVDVGMTEDFREMGEDRREFLDNRIRFLQENLPGHPEVEVAYFQPDAKKGGGAYATVRGRVEKIDVYSCCMVFTDRTALPLDHICFIEGELFGGMDGSGI